MFKRAILATAAAGMLALGAVAATTSGAAAAPGYGPGFGHGPGHGPGPGYGMSVQFGGPGWNVQIGPQRHNFAPPRQTCQPVTKNVKWWDKFGNPHWSKIVVGQKCSFANPGGGRGFPGGQGPGRRR